jgi:Putative zinc-finger
MTVRWTPDKHPHEDVFEDYAFGRLPFESASDFEEHLLACEECQHTLDETDDYIRTMKAATAEYAAERHSFWPGRIRFWDRGLGWNAFAAAVLLVTCLTALLSWRTPPGDPKVIALEAYRGGSTQVPAGRPLDLKIDLRDVQPAAGYRVEVVDVTGHTVWFGGTPVHLTAGLPPGTYWVRLSTDAGESLREFGLIAKK